MKTAKGQPAEGQSKRENSIMTDYQFASKKAALEEIFKSIENHANGSPRSVKKNGKKTQEDIEYDKVLFNKMDSTFKSLVPRAGGFVYANLVRTTALNDGKYRPKFTSIYKRVLEANFTECPKAKQNARMYRVPTCTFNTAECTLSSRKAAKAASKVSFNSVL